MIVTDDLVPNILLMTSLVIGGATGLFAHLIENIDGMNLTSLGQPGPVSFGYVFTAKVSPFLSSTICSNLFSLVPSALVSSLAS